MRASELLRKGVSEAEVARQVGVHRQSVNRWAATLKESGRRGLRQAGRAGRKPRLSLAQLGRIERALKRGPEAAGYETGLWTAFRVADLIEREFGVVYHPGHVWRILRQLGWTPQRPTGKALERDEQAVRNWKRHRWPTLKKTPKRPARPSSS